MPPVQASLEERIQTAFTVIEAAHDERDASSPPHPPVNVVKPLQRDGLSPPPNRLTAPPPALLRASDALFDPKFSRALDFKLRRLKEKEILQTNLRRPVRSRARNWLVASDPNIARAEPSARRIMSRSHPRLDAAERPPVGRSSPRAAPSASEERPRFVTTVKAGRFLLPPPEIASLLGLETLYPPQERGDVVYSYASKPKAVPRGRVSVRQPAHFPPPACKRESPPAPPSAAPRPAPTALFGGVRSLVAGVVGMAHMLDKPQPYVHRITFRSTKLSIESLRYAVEHHII